MAQVATVALCFGGMQHQHQAEAPRIVVDQGGAVGKVEGQVVVFFAAGAE